MADIEHAYQRCLYAMISEQAVDKMIVDDKKEVPDLIVNVVTLSNQWLPDDETIRQWRQQFLELIEQLRAGMVEF